MNARHKKQEPSSKRPLSIRRPQRDPGARSETHLQQTRIDAIARRGFELKARSAEKAECSPVEYGGAQSREREGMETP